MKTDSATAQKGLMRIKDLTGQRFGRLVVLKLAGRRSATDRIARWICRCDCGVITNPLSGSALRSGETKSCGCLRSDVTAWRNTKHGTAPRGKRAPEYNAWKEMRKRCNNPNYKDYKHYGGRGIQVCKRWASYENFLADMGEKPEPKRLYSLDRYPNNDGNYEPRNCRWATQKQQIANQRPPSEETVKKQKLNRQGAKITAEIAEEIREQYKSGFANKSALGRKYGLSASNVWYIVTKRTWKKVA